LLKELLEQAQIKTQSTKLWILKINKSGTHELKIKLFFVPDFLSSKFSSRHSPFSKGGQRGIWKHIQMPRNLL
jgi:hypothetical protein